MEQKQHAEPTVSRSESAALGHMSGSIAPRNWFFAGRTPFEVVVEYLEEKDNEERKPLHRAAAGVGEVLLLLIEAVLLGGIVYYKQFHPLIIAGVCAWIGLRIFGLWRREEAKQRYEEQFQDGVRNLKEHRFEAAASAFARAMEDSRHEEASLGYAYSVGLTGDKAVLLRAVRRLFRLHLYRRPPEEILDTEVYQALLAEPAFQPLRTRLEATLTGEVEELVHLIPGVMQRRAIQILVGLISFTLLALLLTSVMTFL